MGLTAGTRLGPYEIVAAIGAGMSACGPPSRASLRAEARQHVGVGPHVRCHIG
jgi:hypothetical protein